MTHVSTIGLDLAKNIFQAHGADAAGAVVFRRKLRREQVLAFFAAQPPSRLIALRLVNGPAASNRSDFVEHFCLKPQSLFDFCLFVVSVVQSCVRPAPHFETTQLVRAAWFVWKGEAFADQLLADIERAVVEVHVDTRQRPAKAIVAVRLVMDGARCPRVDAGVPSP